MTEPEAAKATHCPLCKLPLYSPGANCPRCRGLLERARDIRMSPTNMPSLDRGAGSVAMTPDERYQVLDALGQGGMGIVYRVWDRGLDEIVALKVLRSLYMSSQGMKRFKQEVRLARRVTHPNVARLYDLCVWHKHLAMTQQFIPGRDLHSLLGKKPLGTERIVHYLEDLCPALNAAHELGVVHGDFKTSNVLVDPEHHAYILDFGLAGLVGEVATAQGTEILVTPYYTAPEVVTSPAAVDQRADIYSLGVVIFRMATGELPFKGASPREILEGHLKKAPPRATHLNRELDVVIDDVIQRCLRKDPSERYPSVMDVLSHARKALHKRLPADQRPTAAGVRGKAVLIDGDAESLGKTRSALEALGVTVVTAADGAAGVEAVLREIPSFVLLALDLEVMDGFEMLGILRSNRRTRELPLIALTEARDTERAAAARQNGATGSLLKPPSPFVLELLVDKYGEPAPVDRPGAPPVAPKQRAKPPS